MRDVSLLDLLHEAADAVRAALDDVTDWGPAGTRPGQYHSDLAADAAALEVLHRPGIGVLSEESGAHDPDAPITVVVDPLDGSTNAARGIPWYATSLCAVDDAGPLTAVVVNQASGVRYEAIRDNGVRVTRTPEHPLHPSTCTELSDAIVGVTGLPHTNYGWRQFRALGAMALDLCAVASGTLDGHVTCVRDTHGPWDYLGGLLVCREAGALVVDAEGRDLVSLDYSARRTPVAAGTSALLDELRASLARDWGGK